MSENENGKAVLFSNMAAVMGDLERIPKNGTNKDQKYKYATSEDIKEAVRKAMAYNKLCLFVDMPEYESSEITARSGTKGTRIRGKMIFTIACGESGETIERQLWGEATDYQDKAFNKLYTTLEKYFLISTFLISTGDEDDTDSTEKEQIAAVSPPRQQKSKQDKPEKFKFPSDAAQKFYSDCQDKTGNRWDNEYHFMKSMENNGLNWSLLNDDNEKVKAFATLTDQAKKESEPTLDEVFSGDK